MKRALLLSLTLGSMTLAGVAEAVNKDSYKWRGKCSRDAIGDVQWDEDQQAMWLCVSTGWKLVDFSAVGTPGPQGPAGAKGATGATGAQGPAGSVDNSGLNAETAARIAADASLSAKVDAMTPSMGTIAFPADPNNPWDVHGLSYNDIIMSGQVTIAKNSLIQLSATGYAWMYGSNGCALAVTIDGVSQGGDCSAARPCAGEYLMPTGNQAFHMATVAPISAGVHTVGLKIIVNRVGYPNIYGTTCDLHGPRLQYLVLPQ